MRKVLRGKRGAALVDVMVTVALLGTIGMFFAATFVGGYKCSNQAQDYKIATAVAQRKMEQLRAMNYESLNAANLIAAGVVDSSSTSSPYSFTQIDTLTTELPSGAGQLEIIDVTSDLRKAVVTVRWEAGSQPLNRSVTLTTYFADKRPRVGS